MTPSFFKFIRSFSIFVLWMALSFQVTLHASPFVVIENGELPQSDVQELKSFLEDLREFYSLFSEKIQIPLQTSIKLKAEGGNASYHYASQTIDTILRRVKSFPGENGSVDYYFSPYQTRFLTAHEYGHALFYATFEPLIPKLQEFNLLQKELHQLELKKTEIKMAQLHLLNELEQEGHLNNEWLDQHPAVKNQLMEYKRMLREIKNQRRALLIKMRQEYRFFSWDIKKYNEFFADLIAVIFNDNNPHTMYDTFVLPEMEINHPSYGEDFYGRDFARAENQIDVWQVNEDVYSSLAPFKYKIYQDFLSKPETLSHEARGQFLDKIIELLVTEINLDLKGERNTDEVNRSLIDSLDKLFH